MDIKPSADQVKGKSAQSDTQTRRTDHPISAPSAEWVIIPPEDNPVLRWDESV